MEPDGVEGALAQIRLIREPTAKESVLAYETSGDLYKALPFHESSAQQSPGSAEKRISLMKCLLGLKDPSIADSCVESFMAEERELDEKDRVQLNSTRVEAAYKLQRWDKVAAVVSTV